MIRIQFGSHDSQDRDQLLVTDTWPSATDIKSICAESEDNCNIAQVITGVVVESLKGAPDETNNAVFHTHGLHAQNHVCPITRPVRRNVILKVVRTTRICLSLLSRTRLRPVIKEALRSLNQMQRQEVLSRIRFSEFNLDVDASKSIAFQLGQCYLLVRGTEVYTKSDIAHHLPCLRDLLARQPSADLSPLDEIRDRLMSEMTNVYVR